MMTPMQCYFLKKKRDMPKVFSEWMDPAQSAIISIDMHRGHLGDEADVTCPAVRRTGHPRPALAPGRRDR